MKIVLLCNCYCCVTAAACRAAFHSMNVGNGGGISIEIGGSGQFDITANTTVTFANCDMQNNTASVEGNCIADARRVHAHVVIV